MAVTDSSGAAASHSTRATSSAVAAAMSSAPASGLASRGSRVAPLAEKSMVSWVSAAPCREAPKTSGASAAAASNWSGCTNSGAMAHIAAVSVAPAWLPRLSKRRSMAANTGGHFHHCQVRA